MHSTVSCARIRRSVRSRWGSRMLSTVTDAVGGLVDQPVVSLDQGACSVGGAGDGAHRRLCHMLRAPDQACAQARVAQRRPAELVVRPGPGVESVARRQRRDARCGHREACAPHRFQRVHIHRLARFGGRVRAVPAPAPACLTHPNPVRRAHARPRVFGLVHERLQQPGAIAVEALTVVADRPCGPAQHVGGQVAARDAGAHQQPAQSQHPVQVSAPALVVPSDPGVAGAQAPRTCREPDAAQPAMRRAHQIPQLRTDERTGAPRVLVRHQRVPDPALLVGLHPHQRQVPQRADRVGHVHCRRHRVREHTRAVHTTSQSADIDAAKRGLLPPGRPTPRSSSRAATGYAHRGNRTLHKRGQRPARDCQRLARPPRPARRAVGRGCPAGCARPDSESPCRPR